MNTTVNIDLDQLKSDIERRVRENRTWYIIQGILFIIFGIVAIALPGVTALSIELLIGILLIVSGVTEVIASFRGKLHWWAIISGLLSVIVGGLMLWKPIFGLIALSILVAVFLVLKAITEIALACKFKPMKHWGWLLFNGILTAILALIAWLGFPFAGVVILAVLIGINMVMYGISLLALTSGVTNKQSAE